MDRRKALAVAGTAAATLVAAGGALAANLGLFSAAANADPVGNLPATAVSNSTAPGGSQPSTTIVYEDTYDVAPASPRPGDAEATSGLGTGASGVDDQPGSTSTTSSTDDHAETHESPLDDRSGTSQSSESDARADD